MPGIAGSIRHGLARFAVACVLALLAASGCSGPRTPERVTLHWLAVHPAPAFDPDGPPDPLRFALERVLSRGLLERDSGGTVVPCCAETVGTSADRRTVTLRLRPGLRFTDGSPVTSADFRAALLEGLVREDHATRAWLLGSLVGVDKVRAGRPLPAIGVDTPDARTLVLHLVAPDPQLLEKLACPGVGVPWKRRDVAAWKDAIGLGPYRVAREDAGRELVFVRADASAPAAARADTLVARFVVGAGRARAALRKNALDVLWPAPPSLLAQPLPEGFAVRRVAARPARRLLLVLRADVPPTTKLPARHALVHALNRTDLLESLGHSPHGQEGWLAGGGAFDFPRLDAGTTRDWLARGDLGSSFHLVLAFDVDGEAAELARVLQGQWARLGIYAELRGQRGADALAEPLRAAAAQAQLVETRALLPGAAAELATLVMPLRGPAVGSFRSGWRTREFDRWIAGPPPPAPLDAATAQGRLSAERVALPLAELPWTWVVREGAVSAGFHPEFGVEFTRLRPAGSWLR
jgi:ABC-type transport system substrate-binding protein